MVWLLWLVLMIPTWSLAFTRYANPTDQGGAPCTNSSAPCGLQEAANTLVAGDTLILQQGTYTPSETEDNCAIWRTPNVNNLTVRPENGHTVEIIGTWRMGEGSSGVMSNLTVDGSAGQLVLNGEYQGRRCGGTAMGAADRCDGCLFTDFEVKNVGTGFGASNYHNTTWRRMNVHHVGVYDNYQRTPECHFSVTGDPYDPNGHGHCHAIYCVDSGSGCANNTLDGVHFWFLDGATEFYGDGHVVKNSIFHDSWQTGPWHIGTGAFTAYNNVIWNADYGILTGNSGSGLKQIYNNTMVNVRHECIGTIGSPVDPAVNTTIRNNLCINPGTAFLAWNVNASNRSNNLCVGTSSQCSSTAGTADQIFANAPANDYHLKIGSPAVGTGLNLAGVFQFDAEGNVRTDPWDMGLYAFAASCVPAQCPNGCCGASCCPPNPDPLNLVAEYKCNGTPNDSSGHGFNAAFNGTFGLPIISDGAGAASCVFDGVNDTMTGPNDPAFRPAGPGTLPLRNPAFAAWINVNALPPAGQVCRLASVGTTTVLGYGDDGRPFVYLNNGAADISGSVPLIPGQNYLLGYSYNGTTVSLWNNNAIIASQAYSGGLVYGGTEVLAIGGVGLDKWCNLQRFDNGRFYDQDLDAADWAALFAELPPQAGVSQTHCLFTAANAPEGSYLGGGLANVPITLTLGAPFGLRCNIKRVGSTITEFFPVYCRELPAGPWTAVSDSLGSLGVQYISDTVISMGQLTTVPLPGDPLLSGGFNPVAGRFSEAPFNTSFKTAVTDGQYTVWEGKLTTGAPLTATDQFECRFHRESGADFGAANYGLSTNVITLTAPPVAGVGGVWGGGVAQGGQR